MTDTPETLQRLILDHKGTRSYARLSADCGGFPSVSRVQRLATRPMKALPEAETLEGLRRGLNVSMIRIVLACARSMGLQVPPSDSSALILEGAGVLPEESKQLLISMSTQLQNANPWSQDDQELAAHKGEPGVPESGS